MIPRYSPPTLFYKLSVADQTLIIKGFYDYYNGKAILPKKYDKSSLEDEIINHFELYHETRMFNDIELVNLVRSYLGKSLDEKVVIEKYPELFV